MGGQLLRLSAAVAVRRVAIVLWRGQGITSVPRSDPTSTVKTPFDSRARVATNGRGCPIVMNEGRGFYTVQKPQFRCGRAYTDLGGTEDLLAGSGSQMCPNCAQPNVTGRIRTSPNATPDFASYCKLKIKQGLGGSAEGLKIRRPSGHGGSTPPPGTSIKAIQWLAVEIACAVRNQNLYLSKSLVRTTETPRTFLAAGPRTCHTRKIATEAATNLALIHLLSCICLRTGGAHICFCQKKMRKKRSKSLVSG
jgi:hypothetical protein